MINLILEYYNKLKEYNRGRRISLISALEKPAEECILNDGGEQQNKEKEGIALDQRQILELEEIILDKDKDAALKFLEENIYKPIKRRRESHCKPYF